MVRHNGPLSPLECPKGVSFINDLPDAANGEVNTALYADDSKIFGAVKCVHDCEVAQTTLSNMDEWTRYNNIQLNNSKCKVLTVTRKKQPVHYNYTLNNVQLTRVAEENDLGIIVISTLSWVKHIYAKANKFLGLLKRTCQLLLPPLIVHILTLFVYVFRFFNCIFYLGGTLHGSLGLVRARLFGCFIFSFVYFSLIDYSCTIIVTQ